MNDLVKKTRGTGTYYEDGSYEFTPQGKGEPVYESVCKVGQSSLGRTSGKEKQSYVAKLKVDANDADPAEAMHEALDKLAAKVWPVTARELKPRGRLLMNQDGGSVRLDAKNGIVSLHLDINIAEGCEYGSKLANFIIETNKCLYCNKDLLTRAWRAIAKRSKQ